MELSDRGRRNSRAPCSEGHKDGRRGRQFEQQDKASSTALDASEDLCRLPEVELVSGICKFGGEENPLALRMLTHHLAPSGPTPCSCLSPGGKPESHIRPQSIWYREQSPSRLCKDNSAGTLESVGEGTGPHPRLLFQMTPRLRAAAAMALLP